MSINKYNSNINNNNENGEEVRGVDRYTGHTWQKYAAVAAAFVLLAGGIGGSVALGKHMDKNSKHGAAVAADAITTSTTATTIQTTTTALTTSRITTTITSTATETAATTMAAVIETKAPEVITAAPAVDRRNPEDLDAFANEWKDKYEEYLWKIALGGIKHEENPVSFKLPEGSVVDKVDAWKVTDEEYCSADAINAHLNAFWAPGIKNDIEIPDLTEKIDSVTADFTDFTYSDFTKGIFFTYKNELYRVASNCGLEGIRTEPTAEKINDNEMLVHWNLGWEGVTEPQTMHLVWVNELSDWRVDDIVDGTQYYGKPSQAESEEIVNELLNGFKDVSNAKYGIGVKYDENDKICFGIHSNDASDGEWYAYYVKVTDSRFSNTDDIKAYLNTKYIDSSADLFNVIGEDLSKYPEGFSFNLESDYSAENTDNAYKNLTNYIMYNGSLYLRYNCFHTHFWGAQNVSLINNMNHDPETISFNTINGNMIVVKTDDDTVTEKECCKKYTLTRNDSGEWKILSSATTSK